jgi:hypothetical protein
LRCSGWSPWPAMRRDFSQARPRRICVTEPRGAASTAPRREASSQGCTTAVATGSDSRAFAIRRSQWP